MYKINELPKDIQPPKDGKFKDPFGDTYYFENGVYHRTDGPAIIYSDGTTEYFLNGIRHREGAPAIIYNYGTSMYFFCGVRHRIDGPAIYDTSGFEDYWYYGKNLSKSQYYNLRTKYYQDKLTELNFIKDKLVNSSEKNYSHFQWTQLQLLTRKKIKCLEMLDIRAI